MNTTWGIASGGGTADPHWTDFVPPNAGYYPGGRYSYQPGGVRDPGVTDPRLQGGGGYYTQGTNSLPPPPGQPGSAAETIPGHWSNVQFAPVVDQQYDPNQVAAMEQQGRRRGGGKKRWLMYGLGGLLVLGLLGGGIYWFTRRRRIA